jgi:2'-5' RNA ligase
MGMRTFLAVPCADAVSARVCQLVSQLGEFSSQVKWVDPENLHLTLKFFGTIGDQEVVEIMRGVQPVVEAWSPIYVQFGGAGAFPALDRPRTLWVGLTAGGESLIDLQKAIDQSLSRRGFPKEGRRFHPHITVGRVRDGASQAKLAAQLATLQDFDVGESTLDEVELVMSKLQPDGPVYTTLARFDMQG